MEARVAAVEQQLNQMQVGVNTSTQALQDKVYALEERLDQVSGQATQFLINQNLAEAAHQQIHSEVAELKKAIANIGGRPGSGHGQLDKNLVPEPYSMDRP